MQKLTNIEKSTFRKGEYVGYANGVWRITKSNSSFGSWAARRQDGQGVTLFAFRLSDMSVKLSALSS
jgi:hypothetical protein